MGPDVDIIAALQSCIARPPASELVVGLSGGLDSTVLLHLLASRDHRALRAIHVDHGLQHASAAWAEHCRQVCRDLAVPLAVIRVQVQTDGSGPEAAARRARWQAYAEHTDPVLETLVLAHHRDDQAETVLLRVLRGAGPAGLSAMAGDSRRSNGLRVWRPLLAVPQADLRHYALGHGLDWIEDPTNALDAADRNFLRNQVMPLLRSRWPGLDGTLAGVAERQAEAHGHERDIGAALLAQAQTGDRAVLRWPVLQAAAAPVRHAALRHWLSSHGCRGIGHARLQVIDRDLLAAPEDANPRLAVAGHVLRRYGNGLYLLAEGADAPLTYELAWDGLTPLALPGGATLAIEPAPGQPLSLTVSNRQGGERLRLHPDGPRRRLKHLLQEAGIPPWQRQRWPVIWLDGEAAAFADRLLGCNLAKKLPGHRLLFQP